MLSVLVPLLLFGLLLLARQRARLRSPLADSPREAPLEAVVGENETPAPTIASPAIAQAPRARAPVSGNVPVRYLLDGDDPVPRPTDRIANVRSRMRGRGICSPR